MAKNDESLEGLRTMSDIGSRECEKLVKVPMKSFDGEALYKCADLLPAKSHIAGVIASASPQTFVVMGTFSYKSGKWDGSDQLPTRRVRASNEKDAIRKAEKVYEKWLKDKKMLPAGSKGLKFNIWADIAEDVEPDEAVKGFDPAQDSVVLPVKRGRGRPKGTTVKAGAARPKMKVKLPSDATAEERKLSCSFDTAKWVKVRRFKSKHLLGGPEEWRCRCGMEGNHNYLPNWVCEKHAGAHPAKNEE